ncbi:aspartate kinase [Winogradskyella haliclonae]|uniref:homoserine dehydrogenase n=1 Tax=Winogradskyella haliclonae TaxID=2048558 RepID=A0ABQ2BVK8_9FLAO|nr:aspartate kinase [Winogradskyella haliclonae]GGI55792.1 aspartokinase [Winogradskyella haliclonae]
MTEVNLIIFGIGNVGSTLINQLIDFKPDLRLKHNIDLRIPFVCNSKKGLYAKSLGHDWQSLFNKESRSYSISSIQEIVSQFRLENVIIVDATASEAFVKEYPFFIDKGFHIVAANKAANTLDYEFYKILRQKLARLKSNFLYETNVGAGLPIIETIKNLNQSGEKVKKIRGVFSGSLSYIFNRFSNEDIEFSEVLKDASQKGYTEPDARDDLSGKDVARKLLILGRELGLQSNLSDVKIQSLVPKTLNGKTTLKQFNDRITELNPIFHKSKSEQNGDKVLRYIGELDVENYIFNVKLVSESRQTSLGQLKGTDTLFEIYTESYNDRPLVIQGAGAGKEVTARGLFSDIIKIANTL